MPGLAPGGEQCIARRNPQEIFAQPALVSEETGARISIDADAG
jgi:hypothetical protein